MFRCVLFHTDIRDLDVFKLYEITVQPFAVRLHFCVFFFQFIIVEDFSLNSIYQEHFARMETFFENNLLFRNRHDTDLRRKDHIAVGSNIISGWTKTITVKDCTHHITIGEQDGSRSVPWLHHGCIILIEISLLLGDRVVVCPWLRDRDHDCKRKFHTTHYKEFQCIVKHCGVGTVAVYDRKDFVKLAFEVWRFHIFFSGEHLVGISTDGVDLSVVYDETVRMCSLPAWVCVGTESGMYHCDRGFILRILQVCKESTKLSDQEHTFVNDRSAAHRNNISVVITLFKLTTCDVEHTIEWETLFDILWFFDKCLHDAWHALSCLVSEDLRDHRNVSPSEKLQSFFFHDDLEHFFCLGAFDLVLREEELCDTIFSFLTDIKALFLTGFFEKFMGDLQKDTNTVTGFSLCILTCTMLQMFYDPESIRNSFMCFLSFDVDNCADTTVVMLKFLAIQALFFSRYFLHNLRPLYQKKLYYSLFCCFLLSFSFAYASAAFTKPRNKGCAWFGLDLNSGCPWVPS